MKRIDIMHWINSITGEHSEFVNGRSSQTARCQKRIKEKTKMSRTAIVTGASRGIGRAVAKRLAKDGFHVVVNYATNAKEADTVVTEIQSSGGRAMAIRADVGNAADVESLFADTRKAFGSVDVVVNNSGIMPLSPIGKGDAGTFDKVIQTNLRGAFLVMAQAAQQVSPGGRIIAFSSSVLAKSFPTYGPYIASKAGVEGLVHVLANELRGRNITVNAVAPGPTGTELFLSGKSPEQVAELAKLAPLERLGEPEDIASVVSFLAGVDGGWINSQVLRANGGFTW
jgi:3-oxoacyl-[acyl-carrier protein] reductase